MSRCGTLLLAITVLAGLPGCRVFDKLTKERDKSSDDLASRTRDKDQDRSRQTTDPDTPPKDWLAGPASPGRGNRVPPADSEPASRTAGQRSLSGVLEDADGRPLPNTYITVENADPIKAGYGAPMGVESDRDGYFEINGLSSSEHYMLSAQVRGAHPQAGRLSVQVPNNKIHLRLKEDYILPPNRSGNGGDLPPSIPAPKPLDTPSPSTGDANPNGHEWSPLGPGGKSSDTPAPSRGDLVAPGAQPDWRSAMPPANIPGPTAPAMPSPTVPTVPAPPLLGPTSKSISRDAKLYVLNTDGKPRTFLTGNAEDLVLLDFITSTCGPCKRAIPAMVSFDDKYGKKVEVIAVLCDNESDSRRVELAAKYRKDQRIPYEVFAESSRASLQDAFNIEAYPSLVLLDGTGRRLWKCHPKNLDEVERILRSR